MTRAAFGHDRLHLLPLLIDRLIPRQAHPPGLTVRSDSTRLLAITTIWHTIHLHCFVAAPYYDAI
jgi:hypothetical protein